MWGSDYTDKETEGECGGLITDKETEGECGGLITLIKKQKGSVGV